MAINRITICKAKDIKPKTSVLRSTFSTQLDFSMAIFKKNIVSLRKCCSTIPETDRLVKEAIEKDFEVLNG